MNEPLLFSITADAKNAIAELKNYKNIILDTTTAIQNFTNIQATSKKSNTNGIHTQVTQLIKDNDKLITSNNRLKASYTALANSQKSLGLSQVSKEAKVLGDTLKNTGNTNSQITKGFVLKWAAVYTAIRSASQQLTKGFDFASTIEQSTVAFRVMTGSVEQSASIMKDLIKLQNTSMMGLAEGAEGTKQMMAYGFAAEEVVGQMKMLAQVGSAVNVSVADMAYVYGTLRSQGRAYTRDLMQFAMRGIPIYGALAETMGVTTAEIKKLTEAGKIGFPEVEKAMRSMVSQGGVFFNLMEEQMNTLGGKFNLLGKDWQRAMGDVITAASPALKTLADSLRQVIKDNPKLFTDLGKAIGEFIKNVTPLIVSLLPSLLKVLTSFFNILNQVLPLIIAVASAVAKLAGAFSLPVAGALLGVLAVSTWTKLLPAIHAVSASIGGVVLSAISASTALKSMALAGAMSFNMSGVGMAATTIGGGGAIGIATILAPFAAAVVGAALVLTNLSKAGEDYITTLTAQGKADLQNKQGNTKLTEALAAITERDLMTGGDTTNGLIKFAENITIGTQKLLGVLDVSSKKTIFAKSTIADMMNPYEYMQKQYKSEKTVNAPLSNISNPYAFMIEQSKKLNVPLLDVAVAMQKAGAITAEAANEFMKLATDTEYAKDKFTDLYEEVLPKLTSFFGQSWAKGQASKDVLPTYSSNIKMNDSKTQAERVLEFLANVAETSVLAKNSTGTAYSGSNTAKGLYDKAIYSEQAPTYERELMEKYNEFWLPTLGKEAADALREADWSDFAKKLNKEIETRFDVADAIMKSDQFTTLDSKMQDFITGFVAQWQTYLVDEGKFKEPKGPKEPKEVKNLGTWWTPLDLAATKTTSNLDNLDISFLKSKESLIKEYNERYTNLKALGASEDAINKLKASFIQASTDLRTASQQEIDTYNLDITGRTKVAQATLNGANSMDLITLAYSNQLDVLALQRKQLIENNKNLKESDPLFTAFNAALLENAVALRNSKAKQGEALQNNAQSGDAYWSKLMEDNNVKIADMSDSLKGLDPKSYQGQTVKSNMQGAMAENMLMGAFGGTALGGLVGGADPLLALLQSALELVMGLESVQEILDPIGTTLKAAFEIIGPMLDGVVKPFVDILKDIGEATGAVLAPFVNILGLVTRSLAQSIKVTILPILMLLGNALAWFNDEVIVHVGNIIIDSMNIVIDAINDSIGWMGIDIERVDRLLTRMEASHKDKLLAESALALADTISYLEDKLQSEVDSLISSATDLYEVGAITAAQYQEQIDTANAYLAEDSNVMDAAKSAETLAEIYDALTYAYAAQALNDAGIVVSVDQMNKDLTSVIKAADTTTGVGTVNTILASILKVWENTYDVDMTKYMERIITLLSTLAGIGGGDTYTGTAKTPTDLNPTISGILADVSSLTSQSSPMAQAILAPIAQVIAKVAADGIVDSNEATALQKLLTNLSPTLSGLGPIGEGYIGAISDLISLASFDVGTSFVSQDMLAQVHKGEIIVPAKDSDSIRNGSLTLAGGKGSSSSTHSDTYITVQVSGSVTTENELTTAIAEKIYTLRSNGKLTV